MHDLLYVNQRRLRDQDLRAYAERLELDVELFDKEMAEHVHAERVHEDFMSGLRSGVNGTPTFYINGVRHDDSYETGFCSRRWSDPPRTDERRAHDTSLAAVTSWRRLRDKCGTRRALRSPRGWDDLRSCGTVKPVSAP
jgi:DSBA-like thioredoxin domain